MAIEWAAISQKVATQQPKQNFKNNEQTYGESSPKIVSEYDQEIPQSQTADNHVPPRGRAAQPPRDTRKTN